MKADFDLYETDPMAHLRPSFGQVMAAAGRARSEAAAVENRSREAIGRLIDGEFDVKPLPNGDFEVTTSPIPPAMRRRQEAYEAKLGEPGKVQAAIADAQRHAADTANPDNPKDKFGAAKPCLSYVPPVALMHEAVVMKLGADKYGPFNWQDTPIQASIYYDAMLRHLLAWFCGEDVDPGSKSGGLHLASVRAGAGILIDAFATGSVIDDRPKKAASASDAIERLTRQRS